MPAASNLSDHGARSPGGTNPSGVMAAERERAGSTTVVHRLLRRDSLALKRVVLDIRDSLDSGGRSVIAKSFGKPGNISESERLGEGLDWKASSTQ